MKSAKILYKFYYLKNCAKYVLDLDPDLDLELKQEPEPTFPNLKQKPE
jgi:hypothetical protein